MTTTIDRGFSSLDETTAPLASRSGLLAVRTQLGFVPEPIARYAHAPQLLRLAQQALHAFEASTFTAVEREVVAFAVIRRNQCEFCVGFHRAVTLPALRLNSAIVNDIVAGNPLEDPRLESLRQFTESMLDTNGDVDNASFERFLDAGFERAQALEVVMGIGAYTMTTLANRLTQVEWKAPA